MNDRTDRVDTLLQGRRERLAKRLLRPISTPEAPEDRPALTAEARDHLVGYAEELYWNEMEWENLTAEEETGFEPLPQLIFPGFLAFVRGLLLDEVMEDALAPAEPRPEVVAEIMRFLARRLVELDEKRDTIDEGGARSRLEIELASHLLDLVMYRYYGLSDAEVERLEELRAASGAVAESGAGEGSD